MNGSGWRAWIAWRLRFLADRISPETAFRRFSSLTVRLDGPRGWVLGERQRGIPLWYSTPDYERGFDD